MLDPEQHKQLKILAIERGVTLTDLIAEALAQYLERQQRTRGKRAQ